MTLTRNALLGSAAAVALALGLTTAPVVAQDDSGTAGQDEQTMQMQSGDAAQDTTEGAGEDAMAGDDAMAQDDAMAGEEATAAADAQDRNLLVVTVGDTEIREADVMSALQALPPQARQQPPQVLVPAVVNQLILRELVLEEARAQGLEEDPDVIAMVESGGDEMTDAEAVEQALVSIWFDRELAGRVTEEDIEAAYEDLQEANPDMDQPLAEVRPQIQNMLQRQAAQTVGAELRQDADITFYDEAGDPVDMSEQQEQSQQ